MPWQEPLANVEVHLAEAERRLDEKIDERFNKVDALLRKLQHQLVWRWSVTIAVLLLAAAGFYFSVTNRVDSNHVSAQDTQYTVHQLELQRRDTIISNCQDQNKRHIRSLVYLVKLAAQEEKHVSPAVKAQIRTNLAEDRILFQLAIPLQNCQQLVSQQAPTTKTHLQNPKSTGTHSGASAGSG